MMKELKPFKFAEAKIRNKSRELLQFTKANFRPLGLGTLALMFLAFSAIHLGHLNSNIEAQNLMKYTGQKNYAFATLLCDDVMLNATSALVLSVKLTHSDYPFLVLTLPQLSKDGRKTLENLGAIVLEQTPLDYPFELTPGRIRDNKPCRYSKLNMWNMTEYSKIIYLDGDTLVVENVDSLFDQYDGLSAVSDTYPDVFNSGVMVLEPSKETYKRILDTYMTVDSYNVGDQGFLNHFFGNQWIGDASKHIPVEYNLLLKYRETIRWKELAKIKKIYHFTGETKPWNFHFNLHKDWEKNSDSAAYFRWRHIFRLAEYINQAQRNIASTGEFNDIGTDSLIRLLSKQFKNSAVDNLCHSEMLKLEAAESIGRRYPEKNLFSVLISTFDRVDLILRLIKHYSQSKKVHTIFVVWHNPSSIPPDSLLKLENASVDATAPFVKILRQKTDSLNNRWNPILELQTPSVFTCDDDVFVDIPSLEFAFSVWKENPNSLTGFFPRYHSYNKTSDSWEYHVAQPLSPKAKTKERKYSIMLTKLEFVKSEFLFYYSCVLPREIHSYIDAHMNCEDIAMQAMVTGFTSTPPTAILGRESIKDFGTSDGISSKNGHLGGRSECIDDFVKLYFGNRAVLKYRNIAYQHFHKIPFEKVNVSDTDLNRLTK